VVVYTRVNSSLVNPGYSVFPARGHGRVTNILPCGRKGRGGNKSVFASPHRFTGIRGSPLMRPSCEKDTETRRWKACRCSPYETGKERERSDSVAAWKRKRKGIQLLPAYPGTMSDRLIGYLPRSPPHLLFPCRPDYILTKCCVPQTTLPLNSNNFPNGRIAQIRVNEIGRTGRFWLCLVFKVHSHGGSNRRRRALASAPVVINNPHANIRRRVGGCGEKYAFMSRLVTVIRYPWSLILDEINN